MDQFLPFYLLHSVDDASYFIHYFFCFQEYLHNSSAATVVVVYFHGSLT